VKNCLDGSFEGFTAEQQLVLELAAEQLSELLYGRADVFIHSEGVGAAKSYAQGMGFIITIHFLLFLFLCSRFFSPYNTSTPSSHTHNNRILLLKTEYSIIKV
jgi:hypothetical protein